MKEIWKDVVGYEGIYSVSSLGRVRRDAAGRGAKPGKILKGSYTGNRYLQVDLRLGDKRKVILVNRLVCEAFHGPCPEGMECRHLDGDRTNNRASNLRWGTKEENMADRDLHGSTARGERSGSTILKSEQVIAAIVRYMRGGVSVAQTGRDIGIGKSAAWKMVTGRSWKDEYEKARSIAAAFGAAV